MSLYIFYTLLVYWIAVASQVYWLMIVAGIFSFVLLVVLKSGEDFSND